MDGCLTDQLLCFVIPFVPQYKDSPELSAYMEGKVAEIRGAGVNCFDLAGMFIKPVQRILKYPLLLAELLKVRCVGPLTLAGHTQLGTKHMASPGGATSKRLDRPRTVSSLTGGAAWSRHVFCPQLYLCTSLLTDSLCQVDVALNSFAFMTDV